MEPRDRDRVQPERHSLRFEILNYQAIQASTGVANAASIRVLEKLGMFSRQRAIADGLDTLFYTLPGSHL